MSDTVKCDYSRNDAMRSSDLVRLKTPKNVSCNNCCVKKEAARVKSCTYFDENNKHYLCDECVVKCDLCDYEVPKWSTYRCIVCDYLGSEDWCVNGSCIEPFDGTNKYVCIDCNDNADIQKYECDACKEPCTDGTLSGGILVCQSCIDK